MLIIIILAGGLAGIDKGGLTGFFGGMAFAAVFVIPLFIHGCIERANGCDQDQARILRHLKD